jgi:hypothetical protein
MEKLKHITILFFLAAAVAPATAVPAKESGLLLQEGLYAEEVDGDLDAAIAIYGQIIKDGSAQRAHVAQALYRQGMCYMKQQKEQQARLAFERLIVDYSDQTKVVSKAKPLLQELGSADPAALMPPDTLVYMEFGSPGKQVETILSMLEGTPLENPLAAIGGQSNGGPSPGNIVGNFLNPNMMAEFKKVRGAGIGITGVAEENPPAIVVLFPGKSDALRGLIFGGITFAGKPVEAIEGMQTVEFTDGGGAAYDDTVVILASPPAYSAGQLTWCVKRYKEIGKEPTLASSNKSFAKVSKKDRQENAFTLWANVDQLYTVLTKMIPEDQMPQEILHANGLADFGNIDDLIAFLTLEEDGVALEANVSFRDGYNGLAYNLFKTPKLNRDALDAVPADAVGIFSIALNGADSPQSQAIREQIRNTAGIDLGGDLFMNIEQITLFALPSAAASMESLSGAPPIFGSAGLALRSPNPRQTRQILTGVLTAANLVASQSGNGKPEQEFGRYQIELATNRTIHCYTDQRSKTTVLSLNPNVIEASVSALESRRPSRTDGPLKKALAELSPGVSKLALVNVGGAIQTGGAMFLSGMNASNDDMAELLAQVAKSCAKTTVQLRTHEDPDHFNFRAEIRDLPPASDLFGPMVQLSQMVSGARNQASAEKREASIPAAIRKASRPVRIDGAVEDLWSGAREYKIANVIYMPASSDADLSASYKTMWDAQNLYVLVNVTDDSLKNDSDSDLWYQDDCVEVFIDADNSKSENYGNNDGQYHFDWDRTNPSMDRFEHGRLDGVEFAMVTTGNGYLTEIKFPWSTLGTKPSAGMKIGLDVHVNDDDDGGDRDTKQTWRGKEDNAWQTPRAFGTAELAGLIGWWKLDETRGRDVADASGNGNVGKIPNGEPRWQTSGGKIGGALLLAGNGDWVHVANESKFDCIAEVTVAAWIKVGRLDKEYQAIVTKGDSAWRLQRNASTDTLEFACSGLAIPGGDQWGGLYGTRSIDDGKWHHIAGVYDGRKMVLYVDGSVDTSQPASGPIGTNDQPVYIGENAEMTGRFWNGWIDDVRVYNCALDQAGIEALYNEGK